MNHQDASPTGPTPSGSTRLEADELQIRNWLRLRRELSELHARLEYLRLMVQLGVVR